jgi:hypothetical protein
MIQPDSPDEDARQKKIKKLKKVSYKLSLSLVINSTNVPTLFYKTCYRLLSSTRVYIRCNCVSYTHTTLCIGEVVALI